MRDPERVRPRLNWANLWAFQRNVPRKYLVGQLLWFAVWVGVTTVGLILSASPVGHGTHQQLGLPPCAAVLMLGRPCPGCGLTTSWTATLHGQLLAAFQAHALGPILYLGFTVSALLCGVGFWRGWRWRLENREVSWLLVMTLVVFASYGAWRFASVRMYYSPEVSVLK